MEFDGNTFLPAVISSFCAWFSMYNILCLVFPEKSYEWNCRFVTLVHASIISTLSWIWGVFYNPWVFDNPGGEINVYESLVVVICLGYFIFDFLWCIWFYTPSDKFMLLHHILTIGGLLMVMSEGRSGTELNATIAGSEISNPFLQFRYFLREAKRDKTWLYEINDFIFMAVFFVCRICIGTCLLYSTWMHPQPWIRFKLGGTAIYIVSVIFMYNIAMFAYKKYTRMYREWKNGRKMKNGDISNGNLGKKIQ